jgi:CrcB protein
MTKALLLFAAGALGTWLRVSFSAFALARTGGTFPWGTFGVNLIGSLLFGFVWAATENRGAGFAELRFYLLAGFMGAFTTFSSLMFDVMSLLSAGRPLAALGNLLAQNLLGLACIGSGLALGRLIAPA